MASFTLPVTREKCYSHYLKRVLSMPIVCSTITLVLVRALLSMLCLGVWVTHRHHEVTLKGVPTITCKIKITLQDVYD